MKTILKYRYVLSAAVVLAALVIIRAINPGIFRYDAVKWAEPSVSGGNIVTPDNLPETGGNILFVILDTEYQAPDMPDAGRMTIDPSEVLSADNRNKIRKNGGPVVLCSEDISVSSRIWMILSQMGVEDLYLLKKDPV